MQTSHLKRRSSKKKIERNHENAYIKIKNERIIFSYFDYEFLNESLKQHLFEISYRKNYILLSSPNAQTFCDQLNCHCDEMILNIFHIYMDVYHCVYSCDS